jgi:glycerophosphoryl diester phosphodiesterase
MKKRLFVAVILVVGCWLMACNASKKMMQQVLKAAPNPVVAHRGAWKKLGLPENSIASLRAAIALKCAGSEFDVRMTADDSLIINHDPVFHKMVIEKTSYADLTKFSLANGEPLPTLRSYLLAGMKDNPQTKLIIEIKPSDIGKARAKMIAQKVLELVTELGAASVVNYISFDIDILKTIVQQNPTAIAQYLEGNVSPAGLDSFNIRGADYHFSVYHKQPKWLMEAREKHIFLNAWTVNTVEEMTWLFQHGIHFITTNEPELLMQLWKENQKVVIP